MFAVFLSCIFLEIMSCQIAGTDFLNLFVLCFLHVLVNDE